MSSLIMITKPTNKKIVYNQSECANVRNPTVADINM